MAGTMSFGLFCDMAVFLLFCCDSSPRDWGIIFPVRGKYHEGVILALSKKTPGIRMISSSRKKGAPWKRMVFSRTAFS